MTNPPDLDERWDQLVEAVRVEFWRMRDEEAEPGDRAHRFIRANAIFAANRMPELRRLLEGAGGSALPDESVRWVRGSEEPTLSPPAFESTKQLDSRE
jgi:hypothetical protein